MGIRDHLFLNLLPTLRSWLSFSMSTYCYDCRCSLPGANYAHRCRSCGRSFCKECMQVQQVGSELPVFCKFCFQAIVGRAESLETLQVLRNSRLAHLQDFSNFSSPRSSRSDEEEDGDDGAKRFFRAASELSLDTSDVDSVNISTGLEFSSFKSVNSSPMDSPSGGGEVAGDNNNGPLDPGYFKKTGAESEDSLDGSHYDNLSVYRNHEEAEKVQQPLDFENNWLIWDPPLPEDENDDREMGFFGYDDEDDDIGDSSKVFSSGSFSIHSLSLREKPSDLHKEQLRSAVHGHFRALVCQLLKGEGLQNGGDVWLDIVSSLAWQAAIFVKPDTGKGCSMDPGNYVKVKCILSGKPSDSVLVKGVVCTKNVKHKRMVSQHKNPRLFLLGGALEYQRVSSKLASINTVLEQETDHLKVSISKIEAHRPNVLLVEKSASPSAQEYLLTKEISLVLNVKRSLMERIARCSGAHIASSIDNIASARLGHCEMFRVEKFSEECPSSSHPNKKFMKTLMFFEGCPRRLGCTVFLRGTHPEELKKVKHVVQYASFAAYHLSRETSFLADEGATLPKISPSRPSVISEKVDVDSSFSVPLSVNSIVHDACEVVAGGPQNLCSFIDDATKCCFPSEDVPMQEDVNSEIPAYSHLAEDIVAGPSEPCEPSDIPVSARIPEEAMDTILEERKNLAFQDEHGSANEGIRTSMEENEAADYYSADSQSILVSLSTACVLKGTICEPSQLIRIKFYGSFDKPLGRYLRDDLFDQTTYCHTCKELAEAHVRCYTHQHGSLSISVRRHPSITLPGEREGRIWMWHRCLKCEQYDGVPPAARRVVMSDAAWGLSFGKFLELSFSNHATANRVASCGHSLQKDCLRFYGCGRMLAFFRYSPVDILSVRLPPLVLDFTCKVQQEWAEREAADFTSRIEFLHMEVTSVLQRFEQKIANSEYEPVKTSIQKYITELKDLLKKERYEYDIMLHPSTAYDNLLFQGTIDILELNRLRRCLLLDSHTWDRRLCLLDSFSKSNSASNLHPQVSEFATYTNPKDWLVESLSNDDKYINYLDETVIKPTTFSKHHEEMNLHTLECNINNMVEMDFSIDSVGLNLISGHFDRGNSEVHSVTEANRSSSSLARLPSAASALSDQIDSLWSGNPDVDGVLSLSPMHNQLYRKVLSPMRVKSFDSALKFRDKMRGRSASLHLTSVRSFDASGDSGNDYMQSPKFVKKSNCVPNHNPVFISSSSHMVGQGARLLLPQSSHDNLVIILYENEPSTIISYAISSQDHTDFITSDHQHNDEPSGRLMVSQFQSDEESQRSKGPHFKISFDDESSIPADKVKFSVTCYFAKQFCTLRKKCCPDEADFLRSLSRCKEWKAQGGKSNVYFAKSFDDRFIIKQVTKTELESFEVFAPEYFNYMMQSINTGSPTCLAKVLGIYQVTVRHLKGGREVKMDLMVMENLFFGRTLSKVYDLKGSSRARYNPDTSGNDKVLLDMNLLESLRTKPIFLGSKAKRRLERAVWNDTSFLTSVDVMDYSLLVGIDDERKELVIGIIDFMRQYTWDKHLETWVKASGILGGPKNSSPTVVSPLQYKKRFRKAMSKYFLTVPDQWSPS